MTRCLPLAHATQALFGATLQRGFEAMARALEAEVRGRLKAPARNLSQDLYVADGLKTGRVMVKDEDVCLHCGLCAERCPTGAWDMQKHLIDITQAAGCASAR